MTQSLVNQDGDSFTATTTVRGPMGKTREPLVVLGQGEYSTKIRPTDLEPEWSAAGIVIAALVFAAGFVLGVLLI